MFYILLAIPPIWMIWLLIFRKNKLKRKRRITLLIILSVPIIMFRYKQVSNHRQAELQYVGTYYLTDYQNCKSCVLKLRDDNTYSVLNGKEETENGAWKYLSGGDFWIVEIGKHGQLGTGEYNYNRKENNFKK